LWVHLGGSYWQRASFDAVVVIAGLLGLFTVAPAMTRFRPHQWATAALLAGTVIVFGYLLVDSLPRPSGDLPGGDAARRTSIASYHAAYVFALLIAVAITAVLRETSWILVSPSDLSSNAVTSLLVVKHQGESDGPTVWLP
jgi:hypothetical protein